MRGHRLDDGLADAAVSQLARILRHHDHDAVHLAQRHQPVFQPRPEIRIVQEFPSLVEDDDGGATIFDHAFDLAEDIGQHRHAFGGHVEDLGHVEPDDVRGQFKPGTLFRLVEDPAIAPARGPFGDAGL